MAKKKIKKEKTDEVITRQTIEDEHRIRKAFTDKDWAEIKSSDSWVIFKVMAEFVEGFEKLSKIGPCVTIFGSARTKPANPYYKMAEDIAQISTILEETEKCQKYVAEAEMLKNSINKS